MHQTNLAAVDLNLLVALRALLHERHVTRAAKSVGLSQPAMSHALGRLRELFDDPLLVRTPRGMQPTPRAEEIAPALGRALEDLGRIVTAPEEFDPARSRRAFTLIADDYTELVLFPKLLARIWKDAPGIDIRVRPQHARSLDDLVEGRADFAFVPAIRQRSTSSGVVIQNVLHEDYVCVVRADHPRVKKKISLADYLALPHALIAPRGESGSVVDSALGRLRRSRRVAVEIPHFLVAPHVVRATDVVLILAERVAAVMAKPFGLRVLEPPAELGLTGFDVFFAWHERQRSDAAHAWLRRLLGEIAKELSDSR
jgi:DNA-binding transcriptional LysR family regulator